MCGISGMFCYGAGAGQMPDESVGLKMVDAIVHRGPDDGGLIVGPGIAMGHRRLAILDLSENGHQPMSDEEGRYWIAYNGEVYNYRQLRDELERSGHRFRSQTDTEVILRGYIEWGREIAGRLNGMFALALWDRHEGSLWLVRDPVGIKPLFYFDDGRTIRFGSEIKAILADPEVARRPDWRGLNAFLTFGYTPSPATGFRGIRQLEPGEWLLAGRKGVTRHRWFTLDYPDGPTDWTAQEAADRLEEAIDAAIVRQMVSDVPLGALLSGGLDSSAVVRAMSRSGAKDIQTFTMGFDEPSFDESPAAARVAELFSTRHRSMTLAADVAAILPAIVSHAEEPFADNSEIPFYLLTEFVRRHVTVALSGDGADELLAGYDTYWASRLAPYYRLLPRPLRRGVVAPIASWLPVSQRKYGSTMLLRRFVSGAEGGPLRDHCSWRRIVPPELCERLYTDRLKEEAVGDPIGDYASTVTDAPEWLSPLGRQMHVDLRFHLPNDMLVKVDRMSMAHSLEVRVPLLDLEVIRTCLAIPDRWKRNGRRGKLALRRILRDDLPQDLIERRKGGFIVPIERWLREDWQPLLRETLTLGFADETGAFEWPVLDAMLKEHATARVDHAYPLFALLVLALWWRIWITGERPQQTTRPAAKPTKVRRLAGEGGGG